MNKITKRKILHFISSKIPLITSIFIFITSFAFQPFNNIKLLTTLIPLFFWGSKQKAFFDFLPVLFLGFLQDFTDNSVFGINIFIFLILYCFVSYQTFFPINTSFIYSFSVFSISILFLLLLKFFILKLFFIPHINLSNIFYSALFIILYYPIFYIFLEYLNLKFMDKHNAGC